MRVLVVEDHDPSRRALHRRLEMEGFNVASVGDANEAIATLRAQAFDWVMLDLMLPDRPGMDVQQFIQDAHIPVQVIVMTGAFETLVAQAAAYSPVAILRKPLFAEDYLPLLAGCVAVAQ